MSDRLNPPGSSDVTPTMMMTMAPPHVIPHVMRKKSAGRSFVLISCYADTECQSIMSNALPPVNDHHVNRHQFEGHMSDSRYHDPYRGVPQRQHYQVSKPSSDLRSRSYNNSTSLKN